MDPKLIPEALRPDHMKVHEDDGAAANETHPVTGYRTTYWRVNAEADFLGWIELVNDDETVGYVYIRRPLEPPSAVPDRYIAMDVLPEFVEPLLRILQSGEPLQIRYRRESENEKYAWLEHRD